MRVETSVLSTCEVWEAEVRAARRSFRARAGPEPLCTEANYVSQPPAVTTVLYVHYTSRSVGGEVMSWDLEENGYWCVA